VACDHDFASSAKVTPYRIFCRSISELFLYCTTSNVTGDFIVDSLEIWWLAHAHRFSAVKTLLLNQDNRPDNHSRRTQFMKQIVEFDQYHQLNIRLAYYPPYHSKYNPIERTWGILENHWNGNILDEIETVVRFAQTMIWKRQHPVVLLVTESYPTGVKLTKLEMVEVKNQIQRFPLLLVDGKELNLGKWFANMLYQPEPKSA
jgi:Rhodopirellula transposase DDE domain